MSTSLKSTSSWSLIQFSVYVFRPNRTGPIFRCQRNILEYNVQGAAINGTLNIPFLRKRDKIDYGCNKPSGSTTRVHIPTWLWLFSFQHQPRTTTLWHIPHAFIHKHCLALVGHGPVAPCLPTCAFRWHSIIEIHARMKVTQFIRWGWCCSGAERWMRNAEA